MARARLRTGDELRAKARHLQRRLAEVLVAAAAADAAAIAVQAEQKLAARARLTLGDAIVECGPAGLGAEFVTALRTFVRSASAEATAHTAEWGWLCRSFGISVTDEQTGAEICHAPGVRGPAAELPTDSASDRDPMPDAVIAFATAPAPMTTATTGISGSGLVPAAGRHPSPSHQVLQNSARARRAAAPATALRGPDLLHVYKDSPS